MAEEKPPIKNYVISGRGAIPPSCCLLLELSQKWRRRSGSNTPTHRNRFLLNTTINMRNKVCSITITLCESPGGDVSAAAAGAHPVAPLSAILRHLSIIPIGFNGIIGPNPFA
jgi:hypothetical protein